MYAYGVGPVVISSHRVVIGPKLVAATCRVKKHCLSSLRVVSNLRAEGWRLDVVGGEMAPKTCTDAEWAVHAEAEARHTRQTQRQYHQAEGVAASRKPPTTSECLESKLPDWYSACSRSSLKYSKRIQASQKDFIPFDITRRR